MIRTSEKGKGITQDERQRGLPSCSAEGQCSEGHTPPSKRAILVLREAKDPY